MDMIQRDMFIETVFREFHGTNDIHRSLGIMNKVTDKLLSLLKNRYNISN